MGGTLRLLALLALAAFVGLAGLDASHAAGHEAAQIVHPLLADNHHGTPGEAPHPAGDPGDCHGVLLCQSVTETAAGTAWHSPPPRRSPLDRAHRRIGNLAAPSFDPPPPRPFA